MEYYLFFHWYVETWCMWNEGTFWCGKKILGNHNNIINNKWLNIKMIFSMNGSYLKLKEFFNNSRYLNLIDWFIKTIPFRKKVLLLNELLFRLTKRNDWERTTWNGQGRYTEAPYIRTRILPATWFHVGDLVSVAEVAGRLQL